jgi:AbrB family looped-hinge helix DNA binding protein
MKSIVGEKGQVTIPKRLRDRLGLQPGTAIDFEESDGRLVGRKLLPQHHLDELLGIMTLPVPTDEFIEELRGPAPKGLARQHEDRARR